MALIIELAFFILTRLYLSMTYWRTYDEYKTCHKLTVILTHLITTILPSDMLIFFGYNNRKNNNDFKTKLINMAWGRRIVSCIRIIIQFTAENG